MAEWPQDLPKVNLFLIGGHKCGTTTLATFLANQPDICWSAVKECWFFCQDDLGDRFSARKPMDWYAQQFKDYAQEKYLADGSVSYLYSDSAIKHITEYNPDAKFIVILRNPVYACMSMHKQMLHNRQEDEWDFATAWRLQKQRKEGVCLPAKCINPKFLFYRDWCLWGKQTKRLLSVVDKKQVLFLFFDDLITNPPAIEKKLANFLHIPIHPGLSLIHENKKGMPAKWIVKADNMLASIQGNKPKTKIYRVLRFLRKHLAFPSSSSRIVASDKIRKYLKNEFNEDIRMLYAITKEDTVLQWLNNE